MAGHTYKKAAATFVAAAIIAVSLGSCQGRTMKNMEPAGETVEVEVAPTPEMAADTVSEATDTTSHA